VVAHNIWAVTDDSLTSRAVPSGHGQLRLGPRPRGEDRAVGAQAASVPGSVNASRWSPKSAMISRRRRGLIGVPVSAFWAASTVLP